MGRHRPSGFRERAARALCRSLRFASRKSRRCGRMARKGAGTDADAKGTEAAASAAGTEDAGRGQGKPPAGAAVTEAPGRRRAGAAEDGDAGNGAGGGQAPPGATSPPGAGQGERRHDTVRASDVPVVPWRPIGGPTATAWREAMI